MKATSEPERLSALERTDIARRHAASAETWLRRLAHHQLSAERGSTYITSGPWRQNLKDRIAAKIRDERTKYTREIDATTFDELIYVICHTEHYKSFFDDALKLAYPLGAEEARIFLDRIRTIRNDISHGRVCSARQLEQIVCYSNDLADALKEHFRKASMGKEYDVPLIVRYVDNRGNESTLDGVNHDLNSRIIDWRRGTRGDLHPGDTLIAEVEIDPSFDRVEYSVYCLGFDHVRRDGEHVEITIENKHVGAQVELRFDVVTKRDWHRQHGKDDSLCLIYRVLPPVGG